MSLSKASLLFYSLQRQVFNLSVNLYGCTALCYFKNTAVRLLRFCFNSVLLVPFYLSYVLTFIIFHPVLWLSFKFKILDGQYLTNFLCWAQRAMLFLFTGCYTRSLDLTKRDQLRYDLPTVIVSNHQSSFDIANIVNFFHPQKVHFVAKIELSRFVPSVSLLLREFNGIIINRKDSQQALASIKQFKEKFKQGAWVAIFPEGTRSKTGSLGKLKKRGLLELLGGVHNFQIITVVFTKNFFFGNPRFFPFFRKSTMAVLSAQTVSINTDAELDSLIHRIFQEIEDFIRVQVNRKHEAAKLSNRNKFF